MGDIYLDYADALEVIDIMRPVVQAARKWVPSVAGPTIDNPFGDPISGGLFDAVRRYESKAGLPQEKDVDRPSPNFKKGGKNRDA